MQNIEQVNTRRYLFQLTWPIFIELALQMLVSNVDQIMVARVSDTAVAAIGNANVVTNLLLITFSVVSMAATILITQYLGANSRERVAETYTVSMVVNLTFGVLISLFLGFGSGWILSVMQLPANIMPEATMYLRIVGAGMIFQAGYLTFVSFLRSNALTRQSMIISVITNLLNIVGNFVLIGGIPLLGIPAMGVAGAAISSVVSRVISCVLIIRAFRKLVPEQMQLSHLRPFPVKQMWRILRIGLPAGGESISYNMTQMVIQTMCNTMPVFVITSRVYCNMFAMLSYIFTSAIGQATQIIVGFLMGARRITDTDKRVNATMWSACMVTGVISLGLWLGCRPLFGLFTSDPQVLDLCQTIMLIDLFLEQGRVGNIVIFRALQAAGDIRFPVILNVTTVWTVAVGGGFLLSIVLGWGLPGIWIAMAADELFRAVVSYLRWRNGKWRSKHLLD